MITIGLLILGIGWTYMFAAVHSTMRGAQRFMDARRVRQAEAALTIGWVGGVIAILIIIAGVIHQ